MTVFYRCASLILCLHLAASLAFCDNQISDSILTTQLRKLTSVHSVTFTPIKTKPKQIIIHLLNWHFISQDDYAADISDVEGKPIQEEELEKRYTEFLDEVEAVQKEQKQILRHLIKRHKIQSVYIEGLTEKNLSAFNKFIKTLREFEVPKGNDGFDLYLKEHFRRDLLQMGVAAQLLISNELKAVLPLENAEAFESANPITKDGKIQFDEAADQRREDAMVKILQKEKGLSVILLGGDHDLSDNLKRMKLGSVRYVRVTTKQYERVLGGTENDYTK